MNKEYVLSKLSSNPALARPMCFYGHICAQKAINKARIPVPSKSSFYTDTQPYKEIYLCASHSRTLELNAKMGGSKVKRK